MSTLYTEEQKLQQARMHLYMKEPWLGTLMHSLVYKLVDSTQIKTACTDGKAMYFNIHFISKLSLEEVTFLVGHELLHCLLNHILRKKEDYIHILWNYACDYAVNSLLIEAKIGTPPEGVLYQKKYAQCTAEKIYRDLLVRSKTAHSQASNITLQQASELFRGSTLDEHLPDVQDDQGLLDELEQYREQEAAQREAQHASGEQDAPIISDKTAQETFEEWRNKFEDFSESMRGSSKGGSSTSLLNKLVQIYDANKRSKIDWRLALSEYIQQKLDKDTSFTRPHRKFQQYGYILPSTLPEETLHLGIALDISGSMSSEWISQFLTEIYNMMCAYPMVQIDLWSFNDEISNHQKLDFTTIQHLKEYKVYCINGTLFELNWLFMEREDIRPDVFILCTDGDPEETWGDDSWATNTLFAIINQPQITAPFGKTIHIDF